MKSTSASHTSVASMSAARVGALALAWAWSIISGSVGLNALIKSNQTQSRLKSQVPPPTIVTINVNDVFKTGVVLTTVSAIIAVCCTIFLLLHLVPSARGRSSRGSLLIQSFILAFCDTWLFATLVPFTAFFANRSAKVAASIGGIQLPPQVIQAAEKSLGSTSIYKKIGYLRLVAILPWFTVVFTAIAAIVLFMASSREHRGPATATPTRDTHSDAGMVEKDPASHQAT